MLRKIIFASVFGVILLMSVPTHSGEITFSGLLKWNSGNYIYSEFTNTAYLYPTLGYKTDRYFASISLPLISQNTDLVTQLGGGMIPAMHGHDDGSSNSGHGMFSGEHDGMHEMNWAIGDLYLNMGITVAKEGDNIPALSFTALVKLPTASTEQNLGTGELDYGIGISASKDMGFVYGFWDVNYYLLGDPQTIDLTNPIGFGLGIGKPLLNGKLSLLAYYYGYTEILDGVEPPRDLTLNANYRINRMYQIDGGFSMGFSESSPDFGLFVGSSVSF